MSIRQGSNTGMDNYARVLLASVMHVLQEHYIRIHASAAPSRCQAAIMLCNWTWPPDRLL